MADERELLVTERLADAFEVLDRVAGPHPAEQDVAGALVAVAAVGGVAVGQPLLFLRGGRGRVDRPVVGRRVAGGGRGGVDVAIDGGAAANTSRIPRNDVEAVLERRGERTELARQ